MTTPLGRRVPVHPHACGEYFGSQVPQGKRHGSPPRLWGIHAPVWFGGWPRRFTPTPVGNTRRQTSSLIATTVHPHACGEYMRSAMTDQPQHGSPPRLWGIRRLLPLARLRQRFTSTPVGNTCVRHRSPAIATVHPHACGEYRCALRPEGSVDGSPPRLWGIPQRTKPQRLLRRFTPTPVGNTLPRSARSAWLAVHPHACGEYGNARRPPRCNGGSPPRLWGIPRGLVCYGVQNRFTPTPVGNTHEP